MNEQISEHAKPRVLFEIHDLHGWTTGALWADIKFDFNHWRDIERLAIVGESKWEKSMVMFCLPFTTANVQYFEHSKLSDAKTCLRPSKPTPT